MSPGDRKQWPPPIGGNKAALAGVFDAPGGSALVLANFTYTPIPAQKIEIPSRDAVREVESLSKGKLEFAVAPVTGRLGR